MINVKEHHSSGYAPRTEFNAKSADWTLALAVDMTTAGERLTKKLAGNRYSGFEISKNTNFNEVSKVLIADLLRTSSKTLNIAGNGIYTLSRHGWSQADINKVMLEVMAPVLESCGITKIYTGGQTGADIAGAVAAATLGVDVEVTLPRGYKQRYETADLIQDKETIEAQIKEGALALGANEARLSFGEIVPKIDQQVRGQTSLLF